MNLQDWWTGELGTRRALILAEQLRTIPESRYRAARAGEEIGVWHWPNVQSVIADQYDLLVHLIAGLGGALPKPDHLYPRPKLQRPEEEARVPSIADFDVDGFLRTIHS